jgi:hypothetical protein
LLLFTYLILKLTLEGVINECNRLAFQQELQQRRRMLKSKLVRLELDYGRGVIDEALYLQGQKEILHELESLSAEDHGIGDMAGLPQ